MIPYSVAIPSYNRPDVIQKRTLAFLERMEVEPHRVTIFVADSDQKKMYARALRSNPYRDNIVIAAPTLRAKRNFISQEHYAQGTRLLCIDDDLRDLIVREPGITPKTPRRDQAHRIRPKEFRALLDKAWEVCEEERLHLWGVYPTSNPLHMRDGPPTFGLKYIVGAFYGLVVRHSVQLLTHYPIKEDHERTLRFYLKDGGVVRFPGVGVDTSYFGGTGGLHDKGLEKRFALSNPQVDILLQEFKGFAVPKERTHGEFTFKDVRLLNLPRLL